MTIESPANEHIEEAHRFVEQQRQSRYSGDNWREGYSDAALAAAAKKILSREEHYQTTVDVLRQSLHDRPQEGNATYMTDELNEAAKKIVDSLYDLVVADSKSKEPFPLCNLLGELIELRVCFPGGHFTVFGHVTRLVSTPWMKVGTCLLDLNVLVHRASTGEGFIYAPRNKTDETT